MPSGPKPRLCELCTDPVDPNDYGTYQHVEGYAQARSAGGLHGLTLRKILGYAHDECVLKVKRGVPARQMEMF